MIFINNDEGTSKTNEPQVWGKPSKFGENLYKKGKTISELFPQKRLNIDVPAINHKILIQEHNILAIPCSVSRNIYEEERTEIDRICSNTLFNIIDTIDEQLEIEKNAVHLSHLIKNQAHNEASNYSIFPLNSVEHIFFYTHISVNADTIKHIFNQTLDQSQNIFWLEYRKFRISASSKAHKIKTLKSTSEESKNKLAISLINEKEIKEKGASNVLYGLQTENKAFTLFSSSYNVDVIKSGLIIHSSKPWICASPDGLILKNGKFISVLEIKCSSSCKKKPIIDPSTGIPNLFYLKISNEGIVLKSSHIYYTQIQILMYCTGLCNCHFYIFNFIEPLLLVIKRDPIFLSNLIPKLDTFYFSYYLPNLCKIK